MEAQPSRLKDMALSLLDARDYAIGASAELGELRYRYELTLCERDLAIHERNLAQREIDSAQREIDSLVFQLNLLHSSRTWKLGRFVLLPLRVVRKVVRLILR